MERAFTDLAQALRERLAVVRDDESRRNQAQHIARLRAISDRIERMQAALPHPINPELRHYLERKSYDKALEYLENNYSGGQ